MKRKTILISRIFSNKNKTLSEITLYSESSVVLAKFKGVELPWKENQKRISCIPANEYIGVAIKRPSNKKYAIHIQNVPNRTAILIHQANRANQLLGCIAPGQHFRDLNGDGIIDVTDSMITMAIIEQHIPLGSTCNVKVIDTYRAIGNIDPKTEPRV
jgi:hypothetical protein